MFVSPEDRIDFFLKTYYNKIQINQRNVHMKKLFFALATILCILLCACFCYAESITWSVHNGVLTISGTGDMPSYAENAAPWNNSFHQYNSVIIDEGITSVGDYAFHLRSSVYHVYLPTTLKSVGKYAFSGCCITELSFPYGTQSVGDNAFAGCPFLSLVSIPSTLVSLSDSAFMGCTDLSAIYVDLANPVYKGHDGVLYSKDMTKLLKYPSAHPATDFTLPKTVLSLSPYTFANCSTLSSVTLHDDITQLAPGSFAWCDHLKSIHFPEALTSIGDYAFYYCTALEELSLPSTLTHIGNYAFGGCDNVSSILFPGSPAQWQEIAIGHNYILTVLPIQYNYQAAPEIRYDITVIFNGEKMEFDTAPLIKDGRTLVPMRAVFEAFGAAVAWEPTTKTVTASRNGTTITLEIDSPILKINNAVLVLDVPAQIIENRTYVPLRAISECLSCSVDWNGETQTVTIKETE